MWLKYLSVKGQVTQEEPGQAVFIFLPLALLHRPLPVGMGSSLFSIVFRWLGILCLLSCAPRDIESFELEGTLKGHPPSPAPLQWTGKSVSEQLQNIQNLVQPGLLH